MNRTETIGPLDVQDVVRTFGADIVIRPGPESAVSRGRYSDPLSRNADAGAAAFTIKSFPIRWTPTDKEIKKAGLTMPVDVIFYVSQKDMDDAGRTFAEIQEVTGTVSMTGELNAETDQKQSFAIQQKARVSQWNAGFLYITIGCYRQ